MDQKYRIYKKALVWSGLPEEEKKLTHREAKNILSTSDAFFLKNLYDFDCKEHTNYWAIINDQNRDISELPSKVRNQIRRCLKDCEIRIISKVDLVKNNGYLVFTKAFERYHDVTVKIPARDIWENVILKSTDFEFWGVFEKNTGELIAYSMVSRFSNYVNYNVLKAIPEYMNKHYPYFGLLYEMNQYYLSMIGMKYVTDGYRSVTGHSNIQPFLEKNFLFRKAYCRITLHYKPWFRFLINLAYPFRKIIPIKQIQHILNFESINRGNFGI